MADTTVISRPNTEAEAEAEDPLLAPESGWKVLLFNDDIHPFDLVVFSVQKAAGLSLEVAEMITFEAHEQGEAVVKRGLTQEDAVVMAGHLRRYTKAGGRFPGVKATAEKDD